MEPVKHDGRARQTFHDDADVASVHVRRNSRNPGFGLHETFPERNECFTASPFSDKDDCAALKVQYQRQILLTFLDADFVNGDILEFAQLGLRKTAKEIAFEDRFDGVPADAEQVRYVLNCHLFCQGESISLKYLGMLTPRFGDLCVDQTDSSAIVTPYPLHGDDEPNRFESDGNSLHPSLRDPPSNDVSGTAARTTNEVVLGPDGQDYVSCYKILPNVGVASQAERVIDETRRHGDYFF